MSFFLAPLSGVYYLGLCVDRWRKQRRRVRLNHPTVSIGNVTWGGTGKTPLVNKLVSDVKNWGKRPAVLTRGYKSHDGFGDEPALLAQQHPDIPIVSDADRVRGANQITEQKKIDLFVLDDGFQHWRVERDLDVVCVDALDPWGGGHLIPWGRLREPQGALARADLVVITRSELVSNERLFSLRNEILRYVAPEKTLTSRFQTLYIEEGVGGIWGEEKLRNQKVLALSAIGSPESFERALIERGANVVAMRYRDHHAYSIQDLQEIESKAVRENAMVVTTEKDAVKLRRLNGVSRLWASRSLLVAQIHHQFSAFDETTWRDSIRRVFSTAHA